MLSSFQAFTASSLGSALLSIFSDISASVLDFLLIKQSSSYSGSSSKKSSFSGISVSFSQRFCNIAAILDTEYRSFLTACLIYGSATLAKSAGDISLI